MTFDLFCRLVGFLWLLDLVCYLPMFAVFFGKIEKSGYQQSNSGYTGKLKLGWLLAGLGMMSGHRLLMLAGTCFFYVLYRHYYIDSRWSSIRRGAGAPGFMSHWTAMYLGLLQMASFLDASGALPEQFLFQMRIDFAVIMICAGVYKYMVGYWHHDGMEYGCVNPFWGYFWKLFLRLNPSHWAFRGQNILASGVEIAAGLLMLHPKTRVLGAVSISLSFLYVAALIRLGRLAWLMTLLPFCFFPEIGPSLMEGTPLHVQTPAALLQGLNALSWAFLAVLPLVKFTQYYNLFANKSLPGPLQKLVSTYANQVPIIMWRVFTPDVTNFYIRIYSEDPEQPVLDEKVLSLSSWKNPLLKLRFWHVTESIASVSVFTTLKYFPSNRKLFEDKLIRYSQSLQLPARRLRYEYVSIHKLPDRFIFVHVGNFRVDLDQLSVSEEKLRPDFDFTAPSKFSPVRESAEVGSFTPR
ncbi:MAG: hypothetical protein U0931_11335 [Vulcanimicrobiota bacterium]